ncbi:hypothetical protein GNX71_30705 [Variovorax sp. RKNM96]|uniref:hypothetical protein n=1 Tax=Variovorax sp. RKNM96 TaxID=2681552 RepID=UPI0019813B0D|nr:hypothetical protein [Variovorax sp. RKNM96]QSI33701.1 hypothetical protein GNX71_30705 [Variovorax sp. RKNM96]
MLCDVSVIPLQRDIPGRLSRFFCKLLFVFGVMMPPLSSGASDEMARSLSHPRVISLKKKINYDEKVARESASEQVVLDLTSVDPPPQLQGWTKKIRDSMDAENVRVVRLEFLKNEEQVRITLKIFDPKNNFSGDNFLLRANAVSTVEINDVPGPADLGSISLMSPETPPELVYWKFRNVLAEVSVFKTSASSLAIAKWIQGELIRSVRPVSR